VDIADHLVANVPPSWIKKYVHAGLSPCQGRVVWYTCRSLTSRIVEMGIEPVWNTELTSVTLSSLLTINKFLSGAENPSRISSVEGLSFHSMFYLPTPPLIVSIICTVNVVLYRNHTVSFVVVLLSIVPRAFQAKAGGTWRLEPFWQDARPELSHVSTWIISSRVSWILGCLGYRTYYQLEQITTYSCISRFIIRNRSLLERHQSLKCLQPLSSSL